MNREASIILAARSGDKAACDAVAAEIGDLARRVCGRESLSGHPDLDWEDLAQTAAQRFFDVGIHQYRGTGSDRSYLYTIVRVSLLLHLRSSGRRRLREEASQPDGPPKEDRQAALSVRLILDKLDTACRDLMIRAFLDDESYREIAGDIGLAESSVRAKVSRCLQKARKLAGG